MPLSPPHQQVTSTCFIRLIILVSTNYNPTTNKHSGWLDDDKTWMCCFLQDSCLFCVLINGISVFVVVAGFLNWTNSFLTCRATHLLLTLHLDCENRVCGINKPDKRGSSIDCELWTTKDTQTHTSAKNGQFGYCWILSWSFRIHYRRHGIYGQSSRRETSTMLSRCQNTLPFDETQSG